MANRLVVEELISAVRSLVDEDNSSALDDARDILPALNRAQDRASSILARRYESPLLAYTHMTLVPNQAEYSFPKNALEDRLEKIELQITDVYHEVRRIDYRELTGVDGITRAVTYPYYYAVIGEKFRLAPIPTTAQNMRIWYLAEPPALYFQQGEITGINIGSNYINVDSVGSELTTDITQAGNFVNIIDGVTGRVKGTLQIQSINGNKVGFKTVPTRASIQTYSIAALADITAPELGDYITLAPYTCISIFRKPFSNYIVQDAVAQIQRKLGNPSDMEERIKQEMEKDVERSWAGRESSLRVSPKNMSWTRIKRW